MCLTEIYVVAFTSGIDHAGSDSAHTIEIQAHGLVRNFKFYNRQGNDMLEDKGDLWKIRFPDFHFDRCIRIGDIETVSIVASNNDGWHIESIVTFVTDGSGEFQMLTEDFDVYRWIDGNSAYSNKRFQLKMT